MLGNLDPNAALLCEWQVVNQTYRFAQGHEYLVTRVMPSPRGSCARK